MRSPPEPLSLACERPARVLALDGAPRRYIIDAELDVAAETDAVQLVQLYWAVEGMQPVVIDLDDDRLYARFRRYAPNAEVAAWTLADELRALPGARLAMVAVTAANESEAGLVLRRATEIAADPTAQEAAA
jgi:hypothetical protein